MGVGARDGGLRTHLLALDLGAGCLQGRPAVVVGNRSGRLSAAARAYTWLVKHTIYLSVCLFVCVSVLYYCLIIREKRLIIEQLYEIYIKLRPISPLEAWLFCLHITASPDTL